MSSDVYGIGSFSNVNAYQTADGAGEQGNGAVGFTFALLASIDSQAVVSQDRVVASVDDATGTKSGWHVLTKYKNSSIQIGLRTSNGTTVYSPAFSVGPALVGKILHIAGVVDTVALTLSLLVDGVPIVAPQPISGYVVPDTAAPYVLGRLMVAGGGVLGADGISWYGSASGHGVMTAAEIATHRAACIAASDIAPLSGANVTATHTHSPKASATGAAAPSTIADQTGSSPMSRVGAPTFVRRNPRWRSMVGPPSNSEIWLVVGESYARGAADDPQNIPTGYPGENLWMVTGTPAFAPLAEPTGIYLLASPGLSPGGAFVWLRHLSTGRPQILVNTGQGGTRTDQWLPSGPGWLEKAIANANFAVAQSGGRLRGIISLLGVNNAIRAAGNFPVDVAAMEAALRAGVTGAGSVPFAFARLQPLTVIGASQPAWDGLRDQQTLYDGSNRYMFDLPAGPLMADGVHFPSLPNQTIGRSVLDVMAQAAP